MISAMIPIGLDSGTETTCDERVMGIMVICCICRDAVSGVGPAD